VISGFGKSKEAHPSSAVILLVISKLCGHFSAKKRYTAQWIPDKNEIMIEL
jgi:hypothetical protein